MQQRSPACRLPLLKPQFFRTTARVLPTRPALWFELRASVVRLEPAGQWNPHQLDIRHPTNEDGAAPWATLAVPQAALARWWCG
eukprot:scaffold269_cov404-Prasinococcus_capsulatus_cf.AAC.7